MDVLIISLLCLTAFGQEPVLKEQSSKIEDDRLVPDIDRKLPSHAKKLEQKLLKKLSKIKRSQHFGLYFIAAKKLHKKRYYSKARETYLKAHKEVKTANQNRIELYSKLMAVSFDLLDKEKLKEAVDLTKTYLRSYPKEKVDYPFNIDEEIAYYIDWMSWKPL